MSEDRKNVGLVQLLLLICLVNTALANYITQDVNNNTEAHLQHHRSRRDLESDDKLCSGLDKAGSFGSLLSKIPVIGEIFDTALTVTTFALKQDYLGTDCSDIPFEKIKKEMRERFDKLDAKVDRNFAAINQLYTEIHRLFNEVTLSIKDSRIQPILSGMKMFIEGFSWYQYRIGEYFNDDNFREIENVLEDLRDAIKRIGGQLSIQVNDILNQNFAVPEDGDDHISILALHALYYGVQAHVSVMLFLLEKRTILAEHYYKNLDFDNYHNQLYMMKVVYSDLKALSSKNNTANLDNNVFGYGVRKNIGLDNSLIDRFYSTAEIAERKINVQRRGSDKALTDSIHEHIEALKKTNDEISQLVLSIIKETPHLDHIAIKNQAQQSGILRVVGDKSQVTVSYAMQYKPNSSSHFMVSDWSMTYTLGETQFAELELPTVADGITRYIFRQIRSENRPQLVGIIDSPQQTLFEDVHRDLYNAAWTGQSAHDIAVRAINSGANVNAIFENGRTPLHAAAEAKNVNLAQALLQYGVNVNVQDENGYTPLHLAAKLGYGEFCNFLISNRADGNIKTNSGLTTLHVAVLSNQISTVKILIQSGTIDVNLGDNNADTPLHYAVNISQSVVEAMLLNGNVDVNAKNNEGVAPLHYAVTNKAENIVTTLLSTRRLDVNVLSNNYMSPLHMAILDSSSTMTKLLLDNAGVNVDIEGPEGLRPIHFAVMAGNVDFTKLLIQKRANLAAISKTKWTPLHFAMTLRHFNVILLLLNEPEVSQIIDAATDEGYTALHMAASAFDDDVIALELIVTNGANVDAKTNDGFTPLHIAAIHNKKDIAYELMRRANNKEKTRDGKLFWELAAAKDSVGVIESLENALSKEEQKRLLNIAAKNDSSQVFRYAVDVRKYEYTENDRQELLFTSIEHNSTKTAKYIIDTIVSHREGYVMASYYKRHLVIAAKNQNLALVQYLINNVYHSSSYYFDFLEASYEYVDEHGNKIKRTALHEAIYSGSIPVIKHLIRSYVNFHYKDEKGRTPADAAKVAGLQDIYGILKYKDTCLNVRDRKAVNPIETDFVKSGCYDYKTESYTWPLHLAIMYDNDIAKELLGKGADVNSLDDSRNTPLHLALAKKKFDLAELIMQKNPDVRIKNNKKEKPVDLGREHGASEDLIAKIEKLEQVLNVKDGFTK